MTDSPSSLTKPHKSSGRKSSSNINILSPQLKEPFQKGWRREVVYRAIVGNEKRNMCDIYYFAPEGKKLRSGREVADYLKQTNSSFLPENFTFCKEPIGMDVEHEVLRFARTMARRNVGARENESPKKNSTARAIRDRVLKRADQKGDGDVIVKATKENTLKTSTTIIDNDETSSKQSDAKRRNTRRSARIASPRERKLKVQLTTGKAKLPTSLHPTTCESDSDHASTPSDDEELESPSGSPNQICEQNVEPSVEQSPVLTPQLPETLPETLPLTSPLIALLPLGTTLILSDSQTVRIIPSNLNSISTPVTESETNSTKVSLPLVASESVATNSSSVTLSSPDATRTCLNSVKSLQNAKSISCSSLIRNILSPRSDGFAVASRTSANEDQIPRGPFGTENRKRSYWDSLGQAIIEEGLQKAKLLHPCQVNPPIMKNPGRTKRKKRVPKKYQDAPKPPSPTVPARSTCKEYFAFRKERRQQQLNS